MAAGTRRWRTISQTVKAERRQPCHLCHQPIDYTLTYRDHDGHINTMRYSGDHLTPTNRGGHDTYTNCGATHLACNAARRDTPLEERPATRNQCSEPFTCSPQTVSF